MRHADVAPVLIVVTWFTAAGAVAQSEASATTGVDAGDPTADQLAHAPVPGAESGRADAPDRDSVWRDIGQGALLPPRIAFEVLMAPVRASVYVVDRYRLIDWWKRVFFDETYTYGLYPTAALDSSYGFTIGARFVHRNLFGEDEHLSLRAGAGGEFRVVASGSLRTGRRLGERAQLELGGRYERRPEDNFFGIGNVSDTEKTKFRQRIERATLIADVLAIDSLHVRGAGAITDLEFAPSDHGTPIDTVYDVDTLTGWTGARNVYGELELRWDRRRYPVRFDRRQIFDHGELLSIYGGYVHELGTSGASMAPVPGDYWRYGGDAQQYIRLGAGPRVLALRARVDAVTGDLDQVVFSQLPELGGPYLLRGYPRERFRDRIAAVGTVQYEWDLNRYVIASIFSDVGRVARTWRDFDPSGLRAGFGVGLQLYAKTTYVATLSIASSIDGGVFVDLVFDPAFDIEPRVERR